MRLWNFIVFSLLALQTRGSLGCKKNGSKGSLSWRLKLLRRVSTYLNPKMKLLGLKNRVHSGLSGDKEFGRIKESERSDRHVPRIECEKYEGTEDLIACPTPDAYKNFYCIEDRHLCDHVINCPNGEDENLVGCMFFRWANSLFRKVEEVLVNG